MPEIPKKKVPEEKRPVPQKEEEAPPPKGIGSLSFQAPSYIILWDKATNGFVSSATEISCGYMSVFGVGLQ